MNLELLFIATLSDETMIFQNQENISAIDPEKSQFFDVLEKSKDSPLVSFVLTNHIDKYYGVDLRDGHFEVNGVSFFLHRLDEIISDFEIDYGVNKSKHFNSDNVEIGEQLNFYYLGWKGKNAEGIEFQRKMVIKVN